MTRAQEADPEWTAAHTLDRLIAEARREMGPERWAALMAEFDAPARTALEQSNVE